MAKTTVSLGGHEDGLHRQSAGYFWDPLYLWDIGSSAEIVENKSP